MISFERVKERKLFQWGVAYLAGAWLILQVLDLLAQPFAWPALVMRAATVLLGAGFVAVLVLAWYHGEQGRQGVSGTELFILATVLVLAGAAVWWVRGDPPANPRARPAGAIQSVAEQNSIAVLPFADLSPARDQEYFSDGVTEELLNALAKVGALRVAARTSSFSFKGKNVPVDEIGQRLRVAHVLEGSIRKDGGHVRIRVQLTNAASGYHLWSETFDRELKDIFALQEEISQAIVAKLEVQLAGDRALALVGPATGNQEAYEHYLKGRFFWGTRTPDGLRRSVGFFEQAIAKDSAYARAWAGLADALMVLPIYTNARPADVQPRAKAAAEKAVQLDPGLGEAWASLAYVRMSYDRDWQGAGPLFQKALMLTPSYVTANHWYGDYLLAQGMIAEAVRFYDRAVQLDPLSALLHFSRGWAALMEHQYDEANAHFRASLELDSTLVDARSHRGRALLFQGRHAEAIDSLQVAVSRSGRRAWELSFLGYAYGNTKQRAEAMRVLEELNTKAAGEYVSPLTQAIVYIGLGDLDDAFKWLDRARKANDPWLTENGFDPLFDPLRKDPRWIRLRKRMGLGP